MNDYRELRIDISPCSEDGTDVLAWLLAEAGFESFVPDERGLTAYVRSEDFDPVKVNDALAQYPFAAALDVSSKTIVGCDWNSEWEKNYFQPIVVGNKCVIHSSFHTNVPEAEYDIVIDPKMAFGTGHHATTSQVAEALLEMDLKGLTLIDVGTGTGILAILAAMKGAKEVFGIEIDEFAYTNAVENVKLNHVDNVNLMLGDAECLNDCPDADVITANINRNVILNDIHRYASKLKSDGTLILSGFYASDIEMIMAAATPLGLTLERQTAQGEWVCLILRAC